MESKEKKTAQFRISFTGFQIRLETNGEWRSAREHHAKAYFRAEISWINLEDETIPRSSSLTSLVAWDVNHLRRNSSIDSQPAGTETPEDPLSLGTYALTEGVNAISIVDPTIDIDSNRDIIYKWTQSVFELSSAISKATQDVHGRALSIREKCVTCLAPQELGTKRKKRDPFGQDGDERNIFLTYASAMRLASSGSGNAKGAFSLRYRQSADDGDEIYRLDFKIDRL